MTYPSVECKKSDYGKREAGVTSAEDIKEEDETTEKGASADRNVYVAITKRLLAFQFAFGESKVHRLLARQNKFHPSRALKRLVHVHKHTHTHTQRAYCHATFCASETKVPHLHNYSLIWQ